MVDSMFLHRVSYCCDDVAIKRLKYIMKDIDDSIVDRYITRDGQYTLFFNTRFGVTLLLFKKIDDKEWIALFKTNYTKSSFLYCLLAARVICKNVHIVVNDVNNNNIMDEAKLLNKAGFKFKMTSSNMFAAISIGGDDIIYSIPEDFGCFIIEENNRLPLVMKRKKK